MINLHVLDDTVRSQCGGVPVSQKGTLAYGDYGISSGSWQGKMAALASCRTGIATTDEGRLYKARLPSPVSLTFLSERVSLFTLVVADAHTVKHFSWMGRSSPPNRIVRAELAIQYKSSKARSIVHTSPDTRYTREKDQVRMTLADLSALGIIYDELFPSRYTVAWKHGQVWVEWRVSEDSYEHRRLQYDVRQADKTLCDVMGRREIASIMYREDSRLVRMSSLPSKPPKVSKREKAREREDPPSPSRIISARSSVFPASSVVSMRDTKMSILPPLKVHASSRGVRFAEVTSIGDPPSRKRLREEASYVPAVLSSKRRKSTGHIRRLEDSEKSAPPVFQPAEYSDGISADESMQRELRLQIAAVGLEEITETVLEGISTPVSDTMTMAGDPDVSLDKREENLPPEGQFMKRSPPRDCNSPMPSFHLDAQETRELLDLKIAECSQVQAMRVLERQRHNDLLEEEKRRAEEVIASQASEILSLKSSLSRYQRVYWEQQTALINTEVKAAQLRAFVDEAQSELSNCQQKLFAEQQEKEHLAMQLDNIKKECNSPMVVPAMVDAFCFVDMLTTNALQKPS